MKSGWLVVWLVLALLASACSGDDGASDGDDSPDGAQESAFASTGADGQPPAVNDSGYLQLIVFGMRNGTELVMLDDPDGAEAGSIPAGANNVYFTGDSKSNAAGEPLWRVEFGDQTGWVPPRFGYPASRDLITDEVSTAFGATSPAQDNAVDTALVVSGLFSFTSPPSGIVVSNIVRTDGAGGHVVIDVIDEQAVGVPGVLGHRVEVVTTADSSSGRYEVSEVWRTAICQNGATNGSCL